MAITINPMMYPPVGPASLAGPPCESRKYRKADQAKQKIDQITNRSSFPSEKIQGQIDWPGLVNEIGTGPMGMDSGARMQVTAAISAVMVIS